MLTNFEQNVSLAPLTTIGLGGPARYFHKCKDLNELSAALDCARKNDLPLYILGGGSNTVFADEGYQGLILQIAIPGIELTEQGSDVLLRVGAGEVWDDVVSQSIVRELYGLELLSGIPGLAGATPIQNVGAYGAEVSQTIHSVETFDRTTLKTAAFNASKCDFSYRRSRFKHDEPGRYIITAVTFKLKKNGALNLSYPELKNHLEKNGELEKASSNRARLETVRAAVLELRRNKSMLYDHSDPESHSCGSFFLNPLLSSADLTDFKERCRLLKCEAPTIYPAGDRHKLAAAWLIEASGFKRGFTTAGGVGISKHHSLALVNRGGTASALLELATAIIEKVREKFGITLEPEPILLAAHKNP